MPCWKMVKKWINKIRNIIIGWTFKLFGLEDNLYNRRWVFCETCPKKVKTSLGEACGECGCILDAKLRVEDEHCDLGRW